MLVFVEILLFVFYPHFAGSGDFTDVAFRDGNRFAGKFEILRTGVVFEEAVKPLEFRMRV